MKNEKKTNEAGQSMLSYVGKATTGYTKKKGQIVCNRGEQADQVIKLLKKSYKSVTQEDGKGGKVIIKFSKNESLGEGLSSIHLNIGARDQDHIFDDIRTDTSWYVCEYNCDFDLRDHSMTIRGERPDLERLIKDYHLDAYDAVIEDDKVDEDASPKNKDGNENESLTEEINNNGYFDKELKRIISKIAKTIFDEFDLSDYSREDDRKGHLDNRLQWQEDPSGGFNLDGEIVEWLQDTYDNAFNCLSEQEMELVEDEAKVSEIRNKNAFGGGTAYFWGCFDSAIIDEVLRMTQQKSASTEDGKTVDDGEKKKKPSLFVIKDKNGRQLSSPNEDDGKLWDRVSEMEARGQRGLTVVAYQGESLSEECSPRDIIGKYPVVASDGDKSVFVNAFDKLPEAVKYCEDNGWAYQSADGRKWILEIRGRIDSANGAETFLKRNPCDEALPHDKDVESDPAIGEAVEKIPFYCIELKDGPGGIDSTGRLVEFPVDFLEIDDPGEAGALANYYTRKYGRKCVVRKGAYHVDDDRLIGKTDTYDEVVEEAIDSDPYGQDNGFFTRDDLNEFTDACLADLGDGYEVSYSYITDGLLEVAFEKDDYEMRADERIDMRKIKKPSDLLKYKDSVVQKVRADYEENIKAEQQ